MGLLDDSSQVSVTELKVKNEIAMFSLIIRKEVYECNLPSFFCDIQRISLIVSFSIPTMEIMLEIVCCYNKE